ncbi:MAG: C25 family cysteine peptidase [Acidobacteriota bacterium]
MLVLALLLSLTGAASFQAQTLPARGAVPSGFQEYFVVGHEDHVWQMMRATAQDEGFEDFLTGAPGVGDLFVRGMNSVVSIVASADGQVIYFDHWEDGFEPDLLNPGQASTTVLGDGDITNGRVCDFQMPNPSAPPVPNPCTGGPTDDLLAQGEEVTFNSNLGLRVPDPNGGAVCPGGAPDLRCSVPVNPRSASDVRYDGGDRILTSGGPIALVHAQDPLSPFIGGAIEILPLQAVSEATSYTVPVGEDNFNGDTGTFAPFKYVSLNLVAFQDGTNVTVTSPGAGSVAFTLDAGEHWSSRGQIDTGPGLSLTINQGTQISTSAALTGMLYTGTAGDFSTRFYALLPDRLYGTDYVTTAPGDNPLTNGTRPFNLYIFNPDTLNPLDVTITDTSGSTTVSVPAGSSVSYMDEVGAPLGVPNGSTVRLTSNGAFWGVSAYDHRGLNNDWGHSWLTTRFLTNTYTVGFAPGVDDPVFNSANRSSFTGDADCVNPPAVPVDNLCDSINRSPVYVAALEDNTLVQVDYDNDGIFDPIDLDSDDFPEPAPLPDNTYVINSLQALKIFDYTDYNNTGTRISTNRPVAVSYGQDTDQAIGSDPIQDTGYTIYPTDQAFLDPVLLLEKGASRASVPVSGGLVTYTITVRSGNFTPVTNLRVLDLLPTGVVAGDYVMGSTRITYPDLSQTTPDPTSSIDATTGRTELEWPIAWPSPPSGIPSDGLGPNQLLTVTYQINLPAGPSASLVNDAEARGELFSSIFNPSDDARVVRTNIVFEKSQTPADATPEAGELITYTLDVDNIGISAESNVFITDPIPANTLFEAGSIVNAGPFVGTFSAAQNAVVWTAASFPAGTSASLSFQVRINPGVPAGTRIPNLARYESTQTPLFDSNEVDLITVGPRLEVTKAIVGNPPQVAPNQLVTFDVRVRNVGAGAANNVRLVDPLPVNATYVPESMALQTNAGPFTSLTDASDGDVGTLSGSILEITVPTLGGGQDFVLRFSMQVNSSTAGLFLSNQADVTSDELSTTPSNLVQVPIVGDATVTGHVFLDLDGNGVQDPGEPDLAGVTVNVTDAFGQVQTVVTDANGDYAANVPPGLTTLDVDDTDPDIPPGVALTTANDPQTVTAVSNTTTASTDVGYQPPATFDLSKASDAGGIVSPGQTVEYSLFLRNFTGITQNDVVVTDSLPAELSYVSGSGQAVVQPPRRTFRVTEYEVPNVTSGTFTGSTYNLTLNQDLSANYFAFVQGSNDSTGSVGANCNHAALTADPFATGQLLASGSPNVLSIQRSGSAGVGGCSNWRGVVTVVETLNDELASGFRLLDVRRVSHPFFGLSGTDTSAATWNLAQVTLLGGHNGAGCDSVSTTAGNQKTCHARLTPSGTSTITWQRDSGNGSGGSVFLGAATTTVMVVEWGSEWTVQQVAFDSVANFGDGANAITEYAIRALGTPVARDNTWVWGSGYTDRDGDGEGAEGVLIALGNGVDDSGTPVNSVALGKEFASNAFFTVFTMTHDDLTVDHRFKADGDGTALTANVSVDLNTATDGRMAVVTNGLGSPIPRYPASMLTARYSNANTVLLERRNAFPFGTFTAFPAWVQGLNFGDISTTLSFTTTDAPTLVSALDNVDLLPGETLQVTFDAQVSSSLPPSTTTVTNAAQANSVETPGPLMADVTDDVVVLRLVVEPNNSGVTTPGSTITYNHTVTNTGDVADAYDLTLVSDQGWQVELIDPDTGAVLAVDSDGDGVWDGGVTISTGTLAPNESRPYQVRVTVPPGTTPGVTDTTTLTAVSNLNSAIQDFAFDETLVIDPASAGPVVLVPDHSGVVPIDGSIVYPHTVFNNTGSAQTFDLQATSLNNPSSSPDPNLWQTTIFADSNGDGVYTPGVDLEISNTANLPDGGSQLFFVLVDSPPGSMPGDVDTTFVTATAQSDPDLFGSATDTTTVVASDAFDLSGGGTRFLNGGETAVFPGTIRNEGELTDTYNFTVGAAGYFGLDGLPHPTELWLDTTGDGMVDTQVASDTNGDGTWDVVDPTFDTDMDGNPDITLVPGEERDYELRRLVDPLQDPYRDPVVFQATSTNTGDIDSVTAVNLLATTTHALVSRFDAVARDGGVLVTWETALESGTVGFRLERQDALGRWRTVRVPGHGALLPGLLHAPQGGVYRVFDADGGIGGLARYRLIEIDHRGTSRLFGPVDRQFADAPGGALRPTAPLPSGGFARMAASSVLPNRRADRRPAAGDAAPHAPPQRDDRRGEGGAVDAVKILTRGEGLQRIAVADLATAFGLTPEAIRSRADSGALRITQGGADVAWHAAATGVGGAVDALHVWAEPIDSIYTRDNVYRVTLEPGVRMETVSGEVNRRPFEREAFSDTQVYEEDRWPLTSVLSDPEADAWFWEFFIANDPANRTKQIALDAPWPSNGEAQLILDLQGASDAPGIVDHRLTVSLNGAAIGTASWDGLASHRAEFAFDASQLAGDGLNQVTLSASLPGGLDAAVSYLSRATLQYPRAYRANVDNTLLAWNEGLSVVSFRGFTTRDLAIYDVTDPRRPKMLTDVRVLEDGSGGFSATVRGPAAATRYWVQPAAAGAVPIALRPDHADDLRAPSNVGRYLVIAGDGLASAANALAAARTGQGVTTRVIAIEDVYDAFSDGIVTPWAIRDLLRHARERWADPPAYVVLVGDGSFDHRDVLGAGGNLVPAPMAATPDGLVPSDNRLADLVGDDGVPELAIGRLPVLSTEELQTYVDKLVAREAIAAGAWSQRITWLADDPDAGGEFALDSARLIDELPPSYVVESIAHGGPASVDVTRQALLGAWADGAQLVSYLGHGGIGQLADEGLLMIGDVVGGLGNGARLPVVTAFTCSVGRIDFPGFDGLAEALVLSADGGAIALWSPSGLVFNADGMPIADAFYEAALARGLRLGDAVRAALATHAQQGGAAHVPAVYTLVGDPMIALGNARR